MADAIIYTTARQYQATLITGDVHFAHLSFVKYFPKTHHS
jgi:predicted nucleic acid-binding protein